MKNVLKKIKEKYQNTDLFRFIDDENELFNRYDLTSSQVVGYILWSHSVKRYINNFNIDKFLESFEKMFYDIALKKIEKTKENILELFLYNFKLFKELNHFEDLEIMPLLKELTKKLNKDEVFELLSKNNLDEDIITLLSNYSKYYDEFYKNH